MRSNSNTIQKFQGTDKISEILREKLQNRNIEWQGPRRGSIYDQKG